MSAADPGRVAREYIDAVGGGDLDRLDPLFDDGLTAVFFDTTLDKPGWTASLGRLLPVLIRNEVRECFVAGERVCVVYDFVTDSAAGAVRCVELLTVVHGRITEIELLLDRVAFAPVNLRLAELAAT